MKYRIYVCSIIDKYVESVPPKPATDPQHEDRHSQEGGEKEESHGSPTGFAPRGLGMKFLVRLWEGQL